jgi:metal-responsive CopG/Arc/MetJ family transcriptional regulator
MKQIRVSLPDGLVERLHPNVKERDKRIRSALEEYLSIPILDVAWSKPTEGRRRARGPGRAG